MVRMYILTKWQLRLLIKYNILYVALVIALFYVTAIMFLNKFNIDRLAIYTIFSDPSQLGFIFIGAIILFEKSENTLPAQNITPMLPIEYLWAKALALMIPALICSLGIAFAAWQFAFNIGLLLLTVSFASIIFTFLGIAGVAHVKTFNQYMLVIPLFLAPTALPLLNFFELTDWKLLYVIPTQSVLSLLSYSIDDLKFLPVLAHISYLLIWVYISYKLAFRSFTKHLIK
ncbi:MAG: hypothetical protein JXA77_05935 [Bacteroidales bacterium]|nr:hypothetical protein [Bacteroidales bacterium]MBN2820578.1 hypothetical protein [Bacteroidales bacterium]